MLYLVLGLVLAAFGLLITALTTANTLFAWVSVIVSVLAAGLLVVDWLRGRRRAREAAEEAEPDPVLARPERPFGDESRPLTETRRRAARREEHAALREDAAEDTAEDTAVPEVEPEPAFEPEFEPEPAAGREPAVEREPEPEGEPVGMVGDAEGEDSPRNGSEPADLGEAGPALAGPPPDERPADPPAGEDRPREEGTAVLSGRRAQEARRTVVDEHGEPGEEPTDATDLLIVTDLPDEVRVVDEHPRYHLATCTYLLDKPTIPLPVAEARQLGFTPCIRCSPDTALAALHRATR